MERKNKATILIDLKTISENETEINAKLNFSGKFEFFIGKKA